MKILTIIPFLVGVLTMLDTVLLATKVVSKEDSYRGKTGTTTYTVNFDGINDQFTPEIYHALSKGDEVALQATYFNKQIRWVTHKATNVEYENSTAEPWAVYLFALVFLLSGLVWTQSSLLKNNIAMYLALVILIGFVSLVRML